MYDALCDSFLAVSLVPEPAPPVPPPITLDLAKSFDLISFPSLSVRGNPDLP